MKAFGRVPGRQEELSKCLELLSIYMYRVLGRAMESSCCDRRAVPLPVKEQHLLVIQGDAGSHIYKGLAQFITQTNIVKGMVSGSFPKAHYKQAG